MSRDPRTVQLSEAAQLRCEPGVWLLLEEARTVMAAGNKAQAIRSGRAAAFRPDGAFEARSRGRSVFVRYVGPSPEPSTRATPTHP